jgi:hypothetical protein
LNDIATLLAHGQEMTTVRQNFFAYIERESLEAMLALDEGAHIDGNDILSETLVLARNAVLKLQKERREAGN